MKAMYFRFCLPLLALALLTLGGCAHPQGPVRPAHLTYTSSVHNELVSLPKPKGKIVVGVYNFRDQTGQYKNNPSFSSYSTAVTQGATAMLIQALKDSGWFIPVERENLSNLLTERKIIRGGTKTDTELPTLLHAPLLLEGGILAYETNQLTGGFGAKYFGLGGSTQYSQDQVTVSLRAVNVNSGEIVKSVMTTKSIFSHKVDLLIFRYIRFKRLLEIETGYSINEPPQMCVEEAIEKAVLSLIIDGILEGNWQLARPEDIHAPAIQRYLEEKQDILGQAAAQLEPGRID